ncbi:acetolactate synthase small subunit [Enterobacillus tribolii]|uniref:acetolactate synthase n=1 Tax=Enterobacillus tribolii TaxID=1487935 RepID=A0A370Q6U3_9GAMM|nr:acetolactate synthase small subunit [Enterobacillus tribolii]MBW7984883.1 acetolactate synthase 1 small subunit [Enterobacillus tribolii]RDK84095.1 acetolactate synthase small subunit [Enterobacillus tribolii]
MSEHQNTPVVLELTVRNHPGVMTHVCGLFARRAFNLEGILCMPLKDGDKSRIWLLVLDDARLPQMINQVDKLEDVLAIHRHNEDVMVFEQVKVFFQ